MEEMMLTAQQAIRDAAGQLRFHGDPGMAGVLESTIRTLVAELRRDEREKCAQIAENEYLPSDSPENDQRVAEMVAAFIAAAIRAQSEEANR